MSHENDLARLRAEVDQNKQAMREVAGSLWALFEGCRSEGFDDLQALKLTLAWLTAITTTPQQDEDDE